MDLANPHIGITYRHIKTFGMGFVPRKQITIGLCKPVPVVIDPQQQAISDHAAIVVAGELVRTAPFLNLRHIAGKNSLQQL